MNPIIFNFFSEPDKILGSWGRLDRNFRLPYKITAYDYLNYAENELTSESEENLINALSNIGRALFLQIDSFLICHNLKKYFSKTRKTTAEKIEFLGHLGLLPTNIIMQVNQVRNYVEHKFEVPSLPSVQNCMDVVYLLVSVLDFYIIERKEVILFTAKDENTDNYLTGEIEISFASSSQTTANVSEDDNGNTTNVGLNTNVPKYVFPKEKEGELFINGSINGNRFNDEKISVYKEPNDYFFLLTFFLNYHRLHMKNPMLFFNKVHYFKNYIKHNKPHLF